MGMYAHVNTTSNDEAHFHLDRFVNKQNWHIWKTRNPQFCDKEVFPSSKDGSVLYNVLYNVLSRNNRSDIHWPRVDWWAIFEDFGKWLHPHYPKWLWFQQGVVNARRCYNPSDHGSAWFRTGQATTDDYILILIRTTFLKQQSFRDTLTTFSRKNYLKICIRKTLTRTE